MNFERNKEVVIDLVTLRGIERSVFNYAAVGSPSLSDTPSLSDAMIIIVIALL